MKRIYLALLSFLLGTLVTIGVALAYGYWLSPAREKLEFAFPPYTTTTRVWLENETVHHIRACVVIDGSTSMFADLPGRALFRPRAGIKAGLTLDPGNHDVQVLGNGQELGKVTLSQQDGITNHLSIYLGQGKRSGALTCRIQNRTNVYGGL